MCLFPSCLLILNSLFPPTRPRRQVTASGLCEKVRPVILFRPPSLPPALFCLPRPADFLQFSAVAIVQTPVPLLVTAFHSSWIMGGSVWHLRPPPLATLSPPRLVFRLRPRAVLPVPMRKMFSTWPCNCLRLVVRPGSSLPTM